MTNSKPIASIVVPAYNASVTLVDTLDSLLAQSFEDFELIVVDDGSTDDTVEIVKSYSDARIRLVCQKNRGLAGAHNTGIHEARGEYIGFCDADDLWLPEKLERHVEHLNSNPNVGISFAGSQLIDGDGKPIGINQSPKLSAITAADIFKRNPIGNGSSAVMRKAALDDFAFRPFHEFDRDWWFDENFRQSDDIEGWLRFATTLDWAIEGIPGYLTLYRVHTGGLSANMEKQYSTWLRMRSKIEEIVPKIAEKHAPAAAAYQLRYLARRAVSMRDGNAAFALALRSLGASKRPLVEEPLKTIITIGAAATLKIFGGEMYRFAETILLNPRTR